MVQLAEYKGIYVVGQIQINGGIEGQEVLLVRRDVQEAKLLEHIKNQDYIQIERKDSAELCTCIPLAISEHFLMVVRFYDFDPYGYEVFPLNSITDICHSDTDVYFGYIVRKEGALTWIKGAPNIDLHSWKSIFSFFISSGENVTVDVGKEGCINIGRITGVTNTSLYMRCFSPTGVWDDEDWIESYKNITGIQFRNSYIRVFSKYLKDKGTVHLS